MWIKKRAKINGRDLLRTVRKGRRKYFTVGNGHHSEETPGRGRSRETGVFGGWLAPAGGPQCGVAGQPVDPVRRGLTRPPPSHTWRGPCFILPDPAGFAGTDTPEFVRTPSTRNTAAGAIRLATSARAGQSADSWTHRANSHRSTRSGSRPSRPAIRRARPRGSDRSRSSQLS